MSQSPAPHKKEKRTGNAGWRLQVLLAIIGASGVVAAAAVPILLNSGSNESGKVAVAPSNASPSTLSPVQTSEAPTVVSSGLSAQISDLQVRQTIGDPSGEYIDVGGHASNLPNGDVIWVVVRAADSPSATFSPNQDCPLDDSGNFQAIHVGVGESNDRGRVYEILVVQANRAASAAMQDYVNQAIAANEFPGIPSLPTGSTVLKQQAYVRPS